jgi:hypothetical protein
MKRVYLGDSVYVEVEHGMLKLTTDNGFGASNTIYLEPEVVAQLVEYLTAMIATGRAHNRQART